MLFDELEEVVKAFNRTIVELKHSMDFVLDERNDGLLIEPLWN